MPIMDGYEATRHIRDREHLDQCFDGSPVLPRTQPYSNGGTLAWHDQFGDFPSRRIPASKTTIIALTAGVLDEQRRKALAAGCDDFVSKPFQRNTILEKVADHLKVRYRYASLYGRDAAKTIDALPRDSAFQASNLDCYDDIQGLTPVDLAVMPATWVNELLIAARRLSDHDCLKLIEQIPPDQAELASILTTLVNQFRFDVILNLDLE
jgi:CheY-like chemotaxis protein